MDLEGRLLSCSRSRVSSDKEIEVSEVPVIERMASVIADATTQEQVRQRAGALGGRLTADEIATIERITAR
jgi:hypothetical protein